MLEEYREYNRAEVRLISGGQSYTVSNINLKGLPGSACGCHLESISINAPEVSGAPGEIGTTGTVTILDYKDAVFKFLTKHLKDFLDPQDDKDTLPSNSATINKSGVLFPKVEITIYCYSGKYFVSGDILSWTMQFSGTTPSIELRWSTVSPSGAEPSNEAEADKLKEKETKLQTIHVTGTCEAFYNDLIDAYGDNITFKLQGGKSLYEKADAAKKLSFPADVKYDPSIQQSSGNKLINGYQFICQNAQFEGSPVQGTMLNSKEFLVFPISQNGNAADTDNAKICSKLVFIQNGCFEPYAKVKVGGSNHESIVIPVTSFSFNADFKDMALSKSILDGFNGTKVNSSNGSSQTLNVPADKAKSQTEQQSAGQGSEAVTFTFECYNVMSFDLYNTNGPVLVKVYNEFGMEHPVSGCAIVKKCSYSLSGAVVKANVECTKIFNSISVTRANGDLSRNKSYNKNQSTPSSNSSDEANEEDNDSEIVKYLKSPDKTPAPIVWDLTSTLVELDTFYKQVDLFLALCGNKKAVYRVLDYGSFVDKLISENNFGLFTLLFAVTACGIVNYEELLGDLPDVLKLHEDFKDPEHYGYKKFFASPTGKAPFENLVGHNVSYWTDDEYLEIYSNIGFSLGDIISAAGSENNPGNWANIILESGTITGIHTDHYFHPHYGEITDEVRYFFEFSSDAVAKNFNNSPCKNAIFKSWVNTALTYKHKEYGYIFHHFLFKKWMDKFWIGMNGVTLQDKIRAATVACNRPDIALELTGNNESQFNKYYDVVPEDKTIKQLAYCRRAADIVGFEYLIESSML